VLLKVLADRPDHVGALKNLAHYQLNAGHAEEAIATFQRAAAFAPKNGEVKVDLGHSLLAVGRLADAKECLEAALAMDGKLIGAHIGLSRLARVLGDLPQALAHAAAALAIDPDFAPALRMLADLEPGRVSPEQWARVERLAEDPRLKPEDRGRFHFALSRQRGREQAYDASFRHLAAANEIRRQDLARRGKSFDPGALAATVEHLIRTFDARYFAEVAGHGSDSDLPVFILGMPRSGTTLCEQILASHSAVHGAGELRDMPTIGSELLAAAGAAVPTAPTPEAAVAQSPQLVRQAAETYLDRLRGRSAAASRITDKLPDNFMRLGLIATLFPKARVVHCRRDPMDTCFSCYAQSFADDVPWAWDLESLGQYYRQYARLMEHWRAVLPNPVLEFVYEDVVENSERASRALVEFVGLSWEEACLEPHKADRPVQTASALQVRQPIYKESVGRWRPYESHLEPLRAALEGKT